MDNYILDGINEPSNTVTKLISKLEPYININVPILINKLNNEHLARASITDMLKGIDNET